jgi:p-aminobenzoyl-glutamate transporter AbgT
MVPGLTITYMILLAKFLNPFISTASCKWQEKAFVREWKSLIDSRAF